MQYRIRYNEPNNLYYFEGRFFWSKWKVIEKDNNKGLIVVRAQAHLYARARVKDCR